MKNLLLVCGLLVLSNYCFSQQDSAEKKVSFLKYELSYLSDNVYLGRKDSVKIPYLTPTISYYHKSGLFLSASASYLSTESRVDAYTFSAGYAFTKKKWDGELLAERSFYNSKSYSVKSESTGDASANLNFDAGFLKPSFTGSLTFGTSTDYAATLGMSHSFSLFDDKGDLAPAVLMNASTQNAYSAYYKKRKYAKTKKGKIYSYTVTADALDARRFKIMDYEITAPFEYALHKLTFSLTPTYAIPVNPNEIYYTVTRPGSVTNRTFTEHLGNTFYWTVGVSIKI